MQMAGMAGASGQRAFEEHARSVSAHQQQRQEPELHPHLQPYPPHRQPQWKPAHQPTVSSGPAAAGPSAHHLPASSSFVPALPRPPVPVAVSPSGIQAAVFPQQHYTSADSDIHTGRGPRLSAPTPRSFAHPDHRRLQSAGEPERPRWPSSAGTASPTNEQHSASPHYPVFPPLRFRSESGSDGRITPAVPLLPPLPRQDTSSIPQDVMMHDGDGSRVSYTATIEDDARMLMSLPPAPLQHDNESYATHAYGGPTIDDVDEEAGSSGTKYVRGPASSSSKTVGVGKTFQCTEYEGCHMSFSRSEHLARHIRKHTGRSSWFRSLISRHDGADAQRAPLYKQAKSPSCVVAGRASPG